MEWEELEEKKKVKLEKNQRLLFRSIEKPTHCPLLSFSFLPPPRTPATRARPKGGCERAGCIAGTERGKDVGPGGPRGAPRGSGSRRSPRSPHPPQQLLRGACMGLVVAVLPGPLARLWRASILTWSRGSWGCKTGFLHFTFSPVCNAPPAAAYVTSISECIRHSIRVETFS